VRNTQSLQEAAIQSKPLEAHMPETYLTDRQLGIRFGVHHLSIRRWERTDPTFPRSIKLTPGCCRWRLADIEAWEASKAKTAA
jgi:prophage regulatory protein